MRLSYRLDFLLRLFDTNMSKLARTVNVDPSLISKWRSGTRRFASDSSHLIAIAEYFIGSEIFFSRKDMLIAEFKRVNIPAGNLNAKKSFEKALIQYLSIPSEVKETKKDYHKEIKFCEIKGCEASYEIFHGIEGKRKAVIKFLKAVLTCPTPTELFLYSQEEMSWLTCDKNFFMQWANLITEVVKRGHRIKIIHNVNRDPSEILKVIEQWLPLHLTGKIEAWFLPKYSPITIKTTIFAAKGVSAIMAVAAYDKTEADYNFYYTSKEIIGAAEGIFYSLLNQSKKLFNVFDESNFTNYYDSVLEIEKQSADSLNFCACISTTTMALPAYEKLINALNMETDQKEKRINMQKKRIEVLKNSLKLYKHIEIEYMESEVDIDNQFTTYKALDGIYKDYLTLSKEDYVTHLKNLLGYIEGCEQFEYIILEKPFIEKFPEIHFYMKQEKGVIVSSDYSPVAITFTESTVVNAFENYLMTLVESIPTVLRSKERNISLLKRRIERLCREGEG